MVPSPYTLREPGDPEIGAFGAGGAVVPVTRFNRTGALAVPM
jgi:hypothetical protein